MNLVVGRKKEAIQSTKVWQREDFVDVRYSLSFELSLVKISEEERATYREFKA